VRAGLPAGLARRLDPGARYGLRLTLLAVAVVLVAVPFGLLLEQVASEGRLTRLDSSLARTLNRQVDPHPLAVDLISAVSFLGKPVWLFVVVGGAVLWLLRGRRQKLAIFLAVTAIGGGLVDSAVKLAVGRPRPVVTNPIVTAAGKSFPSGHAMSSVICYGALMLVFLPMVAPRLRRLVVVLTGLLIALIGASRLALGVHFLSDVVAGFVLGVAWLVASVAVFEVWREERGRLPTEPTSEGVEPEELAGSTAPAEDVGVDDR